MAGKFKLETGVQLLSRLTKKASLEFFYPHLFESGPCFGDVIEISSNSSPNFLLNELITETLIPQELGGLQSGSLMFIMDGNFEYNSLIELLKYKLQKYSTEKWTEISTKKLNTFLELALKNFYLIHLYDATQMYVTIQNLESTMAKYHNISLIVFDTLTAFYWSEQDFRITRMNLYLKNLLKIIQTATKNLKVVIMFTRPQYFSTNESVEKLEPNCCSTSKEGIKYYRIQIIHNTNNDRNVAYVQSPDRNIKKTFKIYNGQVIWN